MAKLLTFDGQVINSTAYIYIYIYTDLLLTFWQTISFLAQFYSKHGPPKSARKFGAIFAFLFPSNLLHFPKKGLTRFFLIWPGSRLISLSLYIYILLFFVFWAEASFSAYLLCPELEARRSCIKNHCFICVV